MIYTAIDFLKHRMQDKRVFLTCKAGKITGAIGKSSHKLNFNTIAIIIESKFQSLKGTPGQMS